jgi:hypothetical protein
MEHVINNAQFQHIGSHSDYAMDWATGVRFLAGMFSLLHRVQTGNRAQRASCPTDTGDSSRE